MDDELKNYIERHRNWQYLALTQFSFANNLFLTIAIGFLVYLFGKEEKPSTITFITMIFLLASIFEGIFVVISRLYDFRISRNVAYARKCYYDKTKNQKKTLPDLHFPEPNYCTRITALCQVLFCKIDFFDTDEATAIKEMQDFSRFNSLRRLSNALGRLSWRCFKVQISLLIFACLFFSVDYFNAHIC